MNDMIHTEKKLKFNRPTYSMTKKGIENNLF